MRRPLIVANWKMNKIRDEALKFVYDVHQVLPSRKLIDTVVCAPAILLRSLVKRQGDNLRIGAQDMHYLESGPYTGEMSPLTLVSTGVEYVILGHSERRYYNKEKDDIVNLKVISALKHKLTPIVCVGETLKQNEKGEAKKTIAKMVKSNLYNIEKSEVSKVVISYEPVWAIGTGKSADSTIAEEMTSYIRSVIADLYGKETADEVRILYGGSVSPSNIKDYLNQANIDGALIGNSALNANNFVEMANIAKETL